uniref:Claudin n=1 Tax=Ciona savignyi TaxID=51511 RepID=H2Y6V1_CIOSA
MGACEVFGLLMSFASTGLLVVVQYVAPWKYIPFSLSSLTNPLVGLWRDCTYVTNSDCQFIGWFDELDVTVTRGCFIAADVFNGISIILLLIAICVEDRSGLIIAKGAFDIVASIILIGACGAFTGLNLYNDIQSVLTFAGSIAGFSQTRAVAFGFVFYMGWGCAGLFMLSGIFLVVAGNQRKNDEQRAANMPMMIMQQQQMVNTVSRNQVAPTVYG